MSREKRHCTSKKASATISKLDCSLRREIGRIAKNELIARGDKGKSLNVEEFGISVTCFMKEGNYTRNHGILKSIRVDFMDDYSFFTAYHFGACETTDLVCLYTSELIELLSQLEQKYNKRKKK